MDTNSKEAMEDGVEAAGEVRQTAAEPPAADLTAGGEQEEQQVDQPVQDGAPNDAVQTSEEKSENVLLASLQASKFVGVCYGMLGNNLPSPATVVQLYKSNNIGLMRLYAPSAPALQALRNSGIGVIVDVPNDNLAALAGNPSAAASWVNTNIRAYYPAVSIRYIAVGNEVAGGATGSILPVMRNVASALQSAGLQNSIKVSTAVATTVIGVPFPPSAGAFSPSAASFLGPVLRFLSDHGAPLLANVYPYFAYAGAGGSIRLDYALFTAAGTVVNDGQYHYQNLFDAMVDTMYAAMEKAGGGNVKIVVSESGWPTAGGTATNAGNARTYNQNLIDHVGKGTPRRPGAALETYIFAMFNENQKPAGVEQHWGLFEPSGQHVYPISFH